MESKFSDIKTSALQLNEKERVELAKSILDSLEKDKLIYEEEWMTVVRERRENYKSGRSASIPWEQTKEKLHQRLNNQ